jgi:hypothetical protein
MKSTTILTVAACLSLMAGAQALTATAQSPAVDAVSTASAEAAPPPSPSAVQNLVRINGVLPGVLPEASPRSVAIRFALYQDQAGGLALWSETQTVRVAADGRYTVLLGITTPDGLPQSLFDGGAARWIEARPVKPGTDSSAAEDTPAPRSLLAAVPYAFKSVDAETLAGRAAADYVTREDLQSAVTTSIQSAAQPERGAPNPALAGSGAAGSIPLWTASSTLGKSIIAQKGIGIGIGTLVPATTLDVNGASTLRGAVSLPAAVATAAAGANSPLFELGASSYSKTARAAVDKWFAWRAVSVGNDTPTPSAGLELLFGSGSAAPAPTGLLISPSGQITFAPGQKFPGGGSGTIAGVTAGSGLKGGGTSGTVTLAVDPTVVPTLSASNIFSGGSNTFAGGVSFARPVNFAPSQTFPGAGTVTGVTAGTGLTGGGTSGTVTLNLNLPQLEGTLNTSYAQLATNNSFTGNVSAQSAQSGYSALTGIANGGALGVNGSTDTGMGIYGTASGEGFAGYFSSSSTQNATLAVYNNASGPGVAVGGYGGANIGGVFTSSSITNPALEAESQSTGAGTAIVGQTSGTAGSIGIEGMTTAGSGEGTGVFGVSIKGYGAWGQAVNPSQAGAGVFGSAINNSATYLHLQNSNSDGLFTAGVWGDGTQSATSTLNVGVAGTADDSNAGVFFNNSSGYNTLYLVNKSGGATGAFSTLLARTPDGACGFGGGGTLRCTGQLVAMAAAGGGERKVETYAMQSPENWMEDFGSGDLVRGVAVIRIDPAFAETVSETADYHVFITPNGDCKGLYVIRKTAAGFEVRESGGGTSSLSFDYRIVAKRRGYETQRLRDITDALNTQFKAVSPAPAQETTRRQPPPMPALHRPTHQPALPITPHQPTPRRQPAAPAVE